MALALGKLTIIVGAGVLGSVLAKEGRMMSNVSDFVSGAFKIAFKQVKQDGTSAPSSKPQTDSLMAQVNSIREELQLLASSRPMTIVTSSSSGGRYGVVIVVVVLGSGYVWWKGWKLPDMMFVTKRGLSDACSTIAKQLETVYSSIAVTKQHLSSRIEKVHSNLDKCAELTATTREEVSELRGDMKVTRVDVQSMHQAFQTLASKINRIEGKQNLTIQGVGMLIARTVDLSAKAETIPIQAAPSSSSRSALESPDMSQSRPGSLPSASLLELPSTPTSSSNDSSDSHKGTRPLQSATSASGLKDLHGIIHSSAEAGITTGDSNTGNKNKGVHITREIEIGDTTSGMFGKKFPGFGGSFLLTRTHSVLQSFK